MKNLLHATKYSSLRHNVELKNAGPKLYFVLRFHIFKVQKEAKLISSARHQGNQYLVRMDGDQKRHSSTVHWIMDILWGGRVM